VLGAPFDLAGKNVGDDEPMGVVCVHGFTSTPYEMRFLGERLADAGFRVRGVLLPGHGTSMDELDRTPWRAWCDAVEAAFDDLLADHAQVALVGQSLGGLLALELASRRPEVAAVCSLAAPLWLPGLAGRLAGWAEAGKLGWLEQLPKLGGSDVRDPVAKHENPAYRAVPVRALVQFSQFMRKADAALPAVTQPVLVVHAKLDHTAPVACAARLAERTRAVRTKLLERSYHLISIDVERDIVAEEVRAFLRRPSPCVT
jgi:carboxylesterase